MSMTREKGTMKKQHTLWTCIVDVEETRVVEVRAGKKVITVIIQQGHMWKT